MSPSRAAVSVCCLVAISGCCGRAMVEGEAEQKSDWPALFVLAGYAQADFDGAASGTPYKLETSGAGAVLGYQDGLAGGHLGVSRSSIRNNSALTGDPYEKRLIHQVAVGAQYGGWEIEFQSGELDFAGRPAAGGSPRDQDVFLRAAAKGVFFLFYGEIARLEFNHMDERQATSYGGGVVLNQMELGIPLDLSIGIRKVDHDRSIRSSRMLVSAAKLNLEPVIITLEHIVSDSDDGILTIGDGSGRLLGKYWSIEASVFAPVGPVILGLRGAFLNSRGTGSETFGSVFLGAGF